LASLPCGVCGQEWQDETAEKLKALETRSQDIANALTECETKIANFSKAIAAEEKRLKRQAEAHQKTREKYRVAQEQAAYAGRAQQTIEMLEDMSSNLTSEIDASKERQEALQARGKKAASAIADHFRIIIKRLLGSEIGAECRFTREEIQLKANYHGELNSAAINTIKVLAFDLAILQAAVQGEGNHPRFLLHDSPREADMGSSLYHQVFHLVRELEGQGDLSPFQYIITTTEAPPKAMQKAPWLRLKLDSCQSDQRLFRANL